MHAKRISIGLGKYPKRISVPRGPHKKDESYALTYVIIDMLKFADNRREVNKILREENVFVNGKVVKDGNFGVGLMDVISFPKINKHYRVLPSTIKSRNLSLKEINEEDAKFKLSNVIGKKITKTKDGKIQISTDDGYTFLTNKDDDKRIINVKDTVVFDISAKNRTIREILKFKEGAIGLITKGKNKGKEGKIANITKGSKNISSLTKIGDIETLTDYVLVTGKEGKESKEEPLIQI